MMKFKQYDLSELKNLPALDEIHADNFPDILQCAGFDPYDYDERVIIFESTKDWNGHKSGSLVVRPKSEVDDLYSHFSVEIKKSLFDLLNFWKK